MKSLSIILGVLLTVVLPGVSVGETTNLQSKQAEGVGSTTVIVTQASPSIPDDRKSEKSVAEEWVIPVLRLAIWPSLVCWALWFYRKEIRNKLQTVKSFKGGENVAVEFAPEVREQQKASANTHGKSEISAGSDEFEKVKAELIPSRLVAQRSQEIRQNLAKQSFTDSQKMELGSLIVAGLQIENHFWRVYNFIFGSQIALLQELNSRSLAVSSAQSYFDNVRARFPDVYATASLDGYLEFLRNFDLILLENGNYVITELGREFLIWIARSQVTPNKHL